MSSTRKPRLILMLLIALCGYFIYGYSTRLIELGRIEAEIDAKETKIAMALVEQAELNAELASLNSPDYLDKAAREIFDMAKPGDTVLMVIKPTPQAIVAAEEVAAPNTSGIATGEVLPVWQQWVDFFTTEELALR